jgi:hypothetical protein
LDKALKQYEAVGLPPNGLDSSEDEILAAITSVVGNVAEEVFFALDSEAYVRIQCAQTEAELKRIRARLDFVHGRTPAGAANLAALAIDYHDYRARVRLAELETLRDS